MSRAASSVADATRFTATSPHASSKPIAPRLSTAKILKSRPSPNAASSHISSQPGVHPLPGLDRAPGPPGETPAQKVARLRAAHLAKRAAEISTWDKVVVRGRQIADTAHKWTVTGIMGITVVVAGVTVFTLVDMITYNRRKKREWYTEQSRIFKQRLLEALEAEGVGTATEDQLLLLREEREIQSAEEARAKKPSVWKSVKENLGAAFSTENLKREDVAYGERRKAILERIERERIAAVSEGREGIDGSKTESTQGVAASLASAADAVSNSQILNTVEEKRREGERILERQGVEGGPLDRFAEQTFTGADSQVRESSSKGKTWSSWFGR